MGVKWKTKRPRVRMRKYSALRLEENYSAMNSRSNNSPQNLLALDFGLRRIGVATGSCVTGTASPLETITAVGGEPDWPRHDPLLKGWKPDLTGLWLPCNQA